MFFFCLYTCAPIAHCPFFTHQNGSWKASTSTQKDEYGATNTPLVHLSMDVQQCRWCISACRYRPEALLHIHGDGREGRGACASRQGLLLKTVVHPFQKPSECRCSNRKERTVGPKDQKPNIIRGAPYPFECHCGAPTANERLAYVGVHCLCASCNPCKDVKNSAEHRGRATTHAMQGWVPTQQCTKTRITKLHGAYCLGVVPGDANIQVQGCGARGATWAPRSQLARWPVAMAVMAGARTKHCNGQFHAACYLRKINHTYNGV